MLTLPRRLLVLFGLLFAFASPAFADEDESAHEPAAAEEHAAEPPAAHADEAEHPAEHAAEHPAEHPAAHDAAEHPAEHAGEHSAEHAAAAAAEEAETPVDPAVEKEFTAAFKDIPDEVVDTERPEGQELTPSLTVEQLRQLIRVARAKVLERMEKKIEKKSAERMGKISAMIGWFSLAGLLLLFMPLVLRKKYPGQGKALLKYSALAAGTFVITVNLFGMVVVGFRSAQSALGPATNPQLRVASAFFDAMDNNADALIVYGKELFGPTLEQVSGNSDAQPMAVLLENGKKLVKDADVFITIAKGFKKLDFIFGILPTVLLMVTMLLFILAIKPTLLEIVRLPIEAAEGRGGGKHVIKRAFRRVGGELLATLCTLGILVLLTFLAGTIMARVVMPAIDLLIQYFGLAVLYLKSVDGAKSGLVFLMLFAVILFLVLNLAAVIVSMSMYLGKAQKIFQRKFNDGVPVRQHKQFWTWGTISLVAAQVLPWLYMVGAGWLLEKINDKLTANVTSVESIPWASIMLIGPLFLVVGFTAVFWAARGMKAIGFLAKYKVPAPVAPAAPAPPVAAAA